MSLGLRRDGHAIGIEPKIPTVVYANRAQVGDWERVAIEPAGDGLVSVRFLAANLQLAMTPDGKLEPRPAGAIGEWERFTIAADRRSLSRVGVTLTIEGDLAQAPSSLHLEARGNDFVDAQGQRTVLAGIDGFDDLWFRTQGREAELDALMQESQQLGFQVRRIWCMGDAGENQVFSLYPQNIPNYFDHLRSLVPYENRYGVIPLFTVFVDAQRVMPDWQEKQRLWADLTAALQGSGSYLLSAVNQVTKNWGPDWRNVSQLPAPGGGVIWSRGSDIEDTILPPNGAPASELHATRNSFDRALMDATASPPYMRSKGAGMVWMTEGNPFGDANGYSERQAWELGRGYSILWALAVLHARTSQRGRLMDDATAKCADAWVRGVQLS